MKTAKEGSATNKTRTRHKKNTQEKFSYDAFNDAEKINLLTHLFVTQWKSFFEALVLHNSTHLENYFKQWQEYLTLQQKLNSHLNYFSTEINAIYFIIERLYQAVAEQTYAWMNNLIRDVKDLQTKNKIKFLTKQIVEALHPNNFVHTNPEILKKLLESHGENFIHGFKQFLQDVELNKLIFNVESVDPEKYSVGKNIAITPGKVIYQNELIQLIQYEPRTARVYEIPLLIIPPWINKYYILDLQSENSFVKWILEQGYAVFLISWVNPTTAQATETFADYMKKGPLAAINIVKEISSVNKINILGYCIGGTMLACALAYLTKQKSSSINSATFLTTMLDFSEPGELGAFIDEEQLAYIEKYMEKHGYLNGEFMTTVFNLLRPQELIWSNYVNRYLKGEASSTLDFLYWNADSTNLAAQNHQFYLREMYLYNRLAKPNGITLDNISIDLSKVNLPTYFLATQKDHIAPWIACYKSMLLFNGSKKFVLANSGHVAGVINPPYKNKYGYFLNSDLSTTSEAWLSNAAFKEGSWWTDWEKWLKNYSGTWIPAQLQNPKYPPLEDAPGSYVKKKLRVK